MDLIGRFLANKLAAIIFAHCVFIGLVALDPPSNASGDDLIEVSVSGKTILVPRPSQFIEGSSLTPKMRRLMEKQMAKGGLTVLALLIPEESREQVERDEFFIPERMALIAQIDNGATAVSKERCSKELDYMRSQQNELLRKARRNPRYNKMIIETQDIFNAETPDIQVNVGELIPRGVFGEGSSFISVGLLMSGSSNIVGQEDEEDDSPTLLEMSMNLVCIEDRILAIYVYATRNKQDDLNWLRSFTLNWMNDIERNSMNN